MEDWKKALIELGCGNFVHVFEEMNYTNPNLWRTLPDITLIRLGFKDAHLIHWRSKFPQEFKPKKKQKSRKSSRKKQGPPLYEVTGPSFPVDGVSTSTRPRDRSSSSVQGGNTLDGESEELSAYYGEEREPIFHIQQDKKYSEFYEDAEPLIGSIHQAFLNSQRLEVNYQQDIGVTPRLSFVVGPDEPEFQTEEPRISFFEFMDAKKQFQNDLRRKDHEIEDVRRGYEVEIDQMLQMFSREAERLWEVLAPGSNAAASLNKDSSLLDLKLRVMFDAAGDFLLLDDFTRLWRRLYLDPNKCEDIFEAQNVSGRMYWGNFRNIVVRELKLEALRSEEYDLTDFTESEFIYE